MADSKKQSFQVDVTQTGVPTDTEAQPVVPSPIATDEQVEQAKEEVSEQLQRRGPSLNETTQSAASAAGMPVADALEAVHGRIVANTSAGQVTVETPQSIARDAAAQKQQELNSGEGAE